MDPGGQAQAVSVDAARSLVHRGWLVLTVMVLLTGLTAWSAWARVQDSKARTQDSERITGCIQDYANRNADYLQRASEYAKANRDALIAKETAQRDVVRKPDASARAKYLAATDKYLATLKINDEKQKRNPAPDPPREACQ